MYNTPMTNEAEQEQTGLLGEVRISVLLPLPLAGPLDYLAPFPPPKPGSFVEVPLSGRKRIGVIWETGKKEMRGKILPLEKLKPIHSVIDVPPLTTVLRRFVDWVAGYNMASQGAVLRMILNTPEALGPPPVTIKYKKGMLEPDRMTAARSRVLDVLADGRAWHIKGLAKAAGVSDSVIRGLIKSGAVEGLEVPADAAYPAPDPFREGPVLTAEQKEAAAVLCKYVDQGGYQTILLEGVTGSGKTEVYFEAVARALRKPGAQVLVLLPEIALTTQWLERFKERFGVPPVEWHSGLRKSERRRAWRAALDGQARVVVGARSALFLPFPGLELIIADEEHDVSFKQEEGVLYHARDMAVVRASQTGIPLILASATPSLESLINCQRERYRHVRMKDRYGGARLPEIIAVDMRRDPLPAGSWLSPELAGAITQTLEAGHQTLLFLNRRGYAPLTLCRACGERLECPNCTAWLVEHRYQGRLMCHHCGYGMRIPDHCPECESEDSLTACGPGVERLAEEVKNRFPAARLRVMASDQMTTPAKAAAAIADIESGRVDIVIGTQIITKGYHFPNLTLVGIIDADLGLKGGDLRAIERTYQQLIQVSGRAGRAKHPGRVLIQTYFPDHPVMAAMISGDQDRFMQAEAEAREAASLPPYGKLVALILSSRNQPNLQEAGRMLGHKAPQSDGLLILGPAPAPLSQIRGRFRARFLIKTGANLSPQKLVRKWLKTVSLPSDVRVKIDIDPYSFL